MHTQPLQLPFDKIEIELAEHAHTYKRSRWSLVSADWKRTVDLGTHDEQTEKIKKQKHNILAAEISLHLYDDISALELLLRNENYLGL